MDKACWSARDAMDASKCDGCDFQEVTHYCAECPMLLCSRCAVSHRRFKDTKTHTLIEAENKSASSREGKEEIELSSEPVPIFCRIHPDQEIFLFCCKCDDILCRLCRKETHVDHETRDLESSKHLLQKLCLNSLTSLFDASTSLKSDDKKIKSSKEYNIQILKRLETELAQRQMALYKHIDQTYDNNLTQLTDETNRIKQVYEKFTTDRNNLLHKSNSLEATLVSIRNIDDVSSLVGGLNEFKDVYNQILRLSIKHVEDAVQLKFDGLQDTKDAENEVLSVTQRFLSIKTKFKDKTLPPVYPSRRTDSGTTSQAKSSSTNTRPPPGNTIHKCVINNGVTLQVIDEDITRHTADMIVNGTMSSVDESFEHVNIPKVAARLRNLPSISASVGPGGATDLTQWTTGSISQSVGRTGKGIESEATLREQQDLSARPKATNMTSQPLNMSTMIPGKTPEQTLNQASPTIDIKVYRGDITNVPAEVIVHGVYAIYNRVCLNGAVGKALDAAGGKSFRDACHNGGSIIEPKQFVITTAGNMGYKMVFHINISMCITSKDWQKMILGCLNEAHKRQLKSIAFPAFGTGTSRSKINELAGNFKSAIESFKKQGSKNIHEIHIVLHDDYAYKKFTEVLSGLSLDKTVPLVYPSRRTSSVTPKRAKPDTSNDKAPSSTKTVNQCVVSNGVTVQVINGDITKNDANMIVNGTVSSIGGIEFIGKLGNAIETAGGSKFKEECKGQKVNPNWFVVTSGGEMACSKVIHVDIFSVPKTRTSKESSWKRIIWEILQKAEGLKMCSIAFPPLGLANLEDAMVTDMVTYYKEVVESFAAAQPKYLKDIRFVIHNNPALLMIFRDVLVGGNAPKIQTFEGAMARETDEHRQVIGDGSTGELELVIVGGDLTKERTDAIVHATSNPISFQGESGKALLEAGGSEFLRACNSTTYESGKHTVFTSGGNLHCTMVLHLDMTYDVNMKGDKQAKLGLLTDRVYECLMAANNLQIDSLSFPAPGTGKWGFKANDIANCFENAIKDFNKYRKTGHLNDIRLVVYDKTMLADFKDRLLFA